jgi:hypothetical protein
MQSNSARPSFLGDSSPVDILLLHKRQLFAASKVNRIKEDMKELKGLVPLKLPCQGLCRPHKQGLGIMLLWCVGLIVDDGQDLVEVAKVGEELAGEVCCLLLDFAAVAHGAVRAGLENLLHAPVLANAVVDAGEAILGAEVEEDSELVLDLRPRELLDHAVVHDEELLLLTVGGTSRARDAGKRLSHHRCVCWLVVMVVVVCVRSVDAAEGVVGVVRGCR